MDDFRIIQHHSCTLEMMTIFSIVHDHLSIIMHHGHHYSDVRHFTHFCLNLSLSRLPIICPSLVIMRHDRSSIHNS